MKSKRMAEADSLRMIRRFACGKRVKRMVEDLFKKHPKRTWYYSTICNAFEKEYGERADLETVVNACRDLMQEGKVHSPHPSRRGHRRVKKS